MTCKLANLSLDSKENTLTAWSSLERNIGGFIANLPALWVLFRRRNPIESSDSRSHPNSKIRSTVGGGNVKRMDGTMTSQDARLRPTNSAVVTSVARGKPKDDQTSDDTIPLTDTRDWDGLQIDVEHGFTIESSTPVREEV